MTAEHAEQVVFAEPTLRRLRAIPTQPLARTSAPAVPTPRGLYPTVGKRLLDIVLAGTLLLVTLPLMALVAVMVRVRLGNPVLFRQPRVGRGGIPFNVYKFRTMDPDRRRGQGFMAWEGTDRRQTHKTDDDPRHTALGRVLRKTSLDELPQLWNVLRGDMSLVGPRPELVHVVARYHDWQHARHHVRPGLTGLWQISARGQLPMHEATHIDLEYLGRVSLRNDLRILLRTPAAVVFRRSGS